MTTRVYLVCLVALASVACVSAAYDPDNCYTDGAWTEIDNQFKARVEGDTSILRNISTCQMAQLGFTEINGMIMGGKGDVSTFGAILGGDASGLCTAATSCMRACQALCCMSNGCEVASVWSQKETTCLIGNSICESQYKFHCFMHTKDVLYDSSERWASCTSTAGANNSDCPALVASSNFGFDESLYDHFVSINQADNDTEECTPLPTSTRRLQSAGPLYDLPATPEAWGEEITKKLNSVTFTLGEHREHHKGIEDVIDGDKAVVSLLKAANKKIAKKLPPGTD